MKLSIIIPVYNEESVIANCLKSLAKQTEKDLEIIVVDDGSTDKTKKVILNSHLSILNLTLLQQSHRGPGSARNLGASKASGEVLVFVDADMEFAPDFLTKLIAPIESGKAIGTFSKNEYLLNKNSVLARCWNLNLGRSANKMHSENYPDKQEVFRAILKSKFEEARGFDESVGYTDDWSIARNLGKLAINVPGATFYHRNPETLKEVWVQARWFGKNEFLTKNLTRKLFNLLRYNPITGFIIGLYGVLKFNEPQFFTFKEVYDTAVFASVLLSFFGEKKYK